MKQLKIYIDGPIIIWTPEPYSLWTIMSLIFGRKSFTSKVLCGNHWQNLAALALQSVALVLPLNFKIMNSTIFFYYWGLIKNICFVQFLSFRAIFGVLPLNCYLRLRLTKDRDIIIQVIIYICVNKAKFIKKDLIIILKIVESTKGYSGTEYTLTDRKAIMWPNVLLANTNLDISR